MSGAASNDASKDRAAADWERRRRLAEVFGDALPDVTSDETEAGERSDPGRESASDRWLKSQVPPHHGG